MLITNTGKMVGTISPGCLENDVFEYTRQRMDSGEAIVVTYDNQAMEDIVWGFGLGCNGVVQVLIERLADAESFLNPISFLQNCFNHHLEGVIATIFAVEGRVNTKIGQRLIINSEVGVNTNIEESQLLEILIKDTQTALDAQKYCVNQYQLPLGSVSVLIEVILPPTSLIIFGAGSDALPLANLAKALGWHITIVDCRAIDTTKERFTLADKVILTRREVVHQQVFVDKQTVAVVMTHNYFDDLEVMKFLLPMSIRYLGVLGPKKRTEKLLSDLNEKEVLITPEQLQKLHAPVGVDIGAETPEEIAVSIIAEIKAVLANHSAGFLKDSLAPIHQVVDGEVKLINNN
jgi:xanthine dehydrogenase accessory factor